MTRMCPSRFRRCHRGERSPLHLYPYLHAQTSASPTGTRQGQDQAHQQLDLPFSDTTIFISQAHYPLSTSSVLSVCRGIPPRVMQAAGLSDLITDIFPQSVSWSLAFVVALTSYGPYVLVSTFHVILSLPIWSLVRSHLDLVLAKHFNITCFWPRGLSARHGFSRGDSVEFNSCKGGQPNIRGAFSWPL